jgi:hypothetical protein
MTQVGACRRVAFAVNCVQGVAAGTCLVADVSCPPLPSPAGAATAPACWCAGRAHIDWLMYCSISLRPAQELHSVNALMVAACRGPNRRRLGRDEDDFPDGEDATEGGFPGGSGAQLLLPAQGTCKPH